MFENILRERVASFRLGGEKIELIPANMRKSAGSYSRALPNGLVAILDIANPAERFWRWHVRIRNEGTQRTAQITELYGMDLTFPLEGNAVWESIQGDSCGVESFLPAREELVDGAEIVKSPVGGRSSQKDAFPYFDVTSGTGSAVFAVGWTGQWCYTLRRDGDTATVQAGFEDCDFYLDPGEEARSCGAIVYAADTLLSARQGFRRLFRERVSPAAKNGGRLEIPLSLQVFDRYFRKNPAWATEEGQIDCVRSAGKIGAFDTYWLDAAWFRVGFPFGVGNYTFEPTFPRGLLPVSEAAHAMGFKFMVWFEPERNDEASDTVRDHPEFMLEDGSPEQRNRLFNLSDDRAAAWLTTTLKRMLRENGIDIYRQDFNINPLPFWRRADAEGRVGYTENRYIANLYRMLDALLAEFPGLLIDNCASGGNRLDFEMNARSVPMWRSDTGCFPASDEKPTYLWNQNQTLGLTRYLPYHATATWSEDTNTFRAAETMGLACNFDVMNDAYDVEAAGRPLTEMLALRPCWDGDFYPLTEASRDDDVWAAYQLDLDGSGFCMFFRRKNAPESQRFTLFAIDPNALYDVTFTDNDFNETASQMRGEELITFTATIKNGNESLVLRYRKV